MNLRAYRMNKPSAAWQPHRGQTLRWWYHKATWTSCLWAGPSESRCKRWTRFLSRLKNTQMTKVVVKRANSRPKIKEYQASNLKWREWISRPKQGELRKTSTWFLLITDNSSKLESLLDPMLSLNCSCLQTSTILTNIRQIRKDK